MDLKRLSLRLLMVGLLSATVSEARAQSTVFAQCAEKNNITLPQKGSGQHLTKVERQTIRQCVAPELKAARQTCAGNLGITLPAKGSGQHLTRAEHKEMRQCLRKAGFPRFSRHRHHRRQQSETSPS